MKYFFVFAVLSVSLLSAVPLEYNNSAWYSGLDPHLIGKRENFLIQGVSVDAIKDANGFTGEFQAVLKFNYGGPVPSIGNLSTISPFDIDAGGVVSTLHAADLFFRENGVLQYGVPLVTHGGPGSINGKPVGDSIFESGDLYKIANGIGTMTSTQFLTAGTNPALFGSGRTVWMTGSVANPPELQSGTTSIYFNGQCSETVCPQAEYTVTLNMNGAPTEGTDWYLFLVGIADGSITPYFTGAACGNDLLEGAVPEPSTWAMLGAGLIAVVFRAKRRN
jgi:hypothetical protein